MSDATGLIASPHVVIDVEKTDPVAEIARLCDEYDVGTVVVGLPRTLSGDEGAAAAAARSLGSQIAAATGRNLVYWDERFTSVEAERALVEAGMRRESRRKAADKVAAAVMLQGYLDHRREHDTKPSP